MTDEDIHNIYTHMSGKAEGIAEVTGTADFPVLFARSVLEFDRMERERLAQPDDEPVAWQDTRKTWVDVSLKNVLQPTAQAEYERGFIDGMQKQAQSSVDRAVNAMAKREWKGLGADDFNDFNPLFKAEEAARWAEAKLKEKNTS